MRRSFRIFIFLALLALAGYAYYSNWFVELNADFRLAPEHIAIYAYDMDYHDCKVKLSWEYTTNVSWIRKDQTYFVPIHDFQQWNGVSLESIKFLGDPVKISIWCDEGRKSADVDNHYVQ